MDWLTAERKQFLTTFIGAGYITIGLTTLAMMSCFLAFFFITLCGLLLLPPVRAVIGTRLDRSAPGWALGLLVVLGPVLYIFFQWLNGTLHVVTPWM